MRQVRVIGGGIAGIEAALTLSHGLDDAEVSVVSRDAILRLMPELVYVPVGVEARGIEVDLEQQLVEAGIELVRGEVDCVDVPARTVVVDDETLAWDVLVVAPGAAPTPSSGLQLRTPEQAAAVRSRVLELVADVRESEDPRSIVIRAAADNAWSPPAWELAALLGTWRAAEGLERLLELTLVTAEMSAFEWFEPDVADIVVERLRSLGVELAIGVPEPRFDELGGDLVIDFGPIEARHVPGVPGRGADGWYDVDQHCSVAPDVFVVGDAAHTGYKAAFAAAWHARRVLELLGGDPERIGHAHAGVPIDQVEYQFDLGDRTMCVRLPVAASLADPWLGHESEVRVVDRPPVKLAGMLVGDLVAAADMVRGPLAYRELVEGATRR